MFIENELGSSSEFLLKTCLSDWNRATHMTSAEWRTICQRVAADCHLAATCSGQLGPLVTAGHMPGATHLWLRRVEAGWATRMPPILAVPEVSEVMIWLVPSRHHLMLQLQSLGSQLNKHSPRTVTFAPGLARLPTRPRPTVKPVLVGEPTDSVGLGDAFELALGFRAMRIARWVLCLLQ